MNNVAIGGSQAADQSLLIYGLNVPDSGSVYSYMIGTNDRWGYQNLASGPALFQMIHLADIVYLAIPERKKLRCTSLLCHYGPGWWADALYPDCPVSAWCAQPGSAVSFSLTGSALYLSMGMSDGNNGIYTVKVDGQQIGTYYAFGGTPSQSQAIQTFDYGTKVAPQLVRIADSQGTHSIIITVVSGLIYFDWAASNEGLDLQNGPVVLVGGLPLQRTDDNRGGAPASYLQPYADAVSQNVRLLAGDNLPIAFVDTFGAFAGTDPRTGQPVVDLCITNGSDDIHPNDYGHSLLAQKFIAAYKLPLANGPAVWSRLGGSIVGRPSPANNGDGRLEVLAWGSDSTIHDIAQAAPGSAWNGFRSLGGFITGNAVIAANQNGVLEAFARGGDNALWMTSQSAPGGTWSGTFATLRGALISDAAVGINSNGTLDVFVLGTDNNLWHNMQISPGGSWRGWSGLGGRFTGLPAVVSNQDGRLQVFARGADNALWTLAQITPGGSWSAPASLGGVLKTNPAAALNSNGIVQAFVIGGDTSLWTIAQASAGSQGFGSWTNLGGSADADPSIAVNQDGRLEAFVLGGDNALWHNSQTSAGSSTWSGWTTLQGTFQGAPSAIRTSSGEIAVFVRAPDNTLWYIQQRSVGVWN